MKSVRRLLCIALCACAGPVAVGAQPAPVATRPADRPDSVPWRPVLEYVVRSLSGEIVRASATAAPQPWHIVLPDSTPVWAAFRTHLMQSLGARDARASDVARNELTIGAMTFRGDTAWVKVVRTHTALCGDGVKTTGFGNVENVFIVRREQFWSAARSPSVAHGDRVGCSR